MKFKREMIILMLILCMIFTISTISAADNDIQAVNLADSNDQDVIASDESVQTISFDNDDNLEKENDVEILSDSDGSLSNLSSEISGKTEYKLERNYTFDSSKDSSLTSGITISNSITIDGQGHTIDAKGKSRIFNVGANRVTFKNIIFANGYSSSGAAAINSNEDVSYMNIENCTFINNTGKYGAIYIYYASGDIIKNSVFINNTGTISGAITWVYYGGNIDGCIFMNNRGNNAGSIYWAVFYNDAYVSNSIFLNNTGTYDVYYNNQYASNYNNILKLDRNWFGNTVDNTDRPNVSSSVTMDNWYVLNITTNGANNIATISLNNLYDGSGINPCDTYALPSITFTVRGNNATVNKNTVTTNSEGKASFGFSVTENTGELIVSANGFSYAKDVVNMADEGSIAALNTKITKAIAQGESEVKLYNDYLYDDADLVINNLNGKQNGIGIASNLTIDGQGFTIDGNNKGGRIFYFRDDSKSAILKNINFINCKDGYAGVFYSNFKNMDIINCTFTNCYVDSNHGAVMDAMNTVTKIINCTFKDNNANSKNGGAVYLRPSDSCDVINSTFINNKANNGGAIYFYGSSNLKANVIGCSFTDNKLYSDSSSGTAIYCNGQGVFTVNNCIFLNNEGCYEIINSTTSTLDLNYNWWGNTFDNKDNYSLAKYNDVNVFNKWFFLDMEVNSDNSVVYIALNKLYVYLDDSMVYDNYSLPEITLNIEAINATLSTNTIKLNKTGEATFSYDLTQKTGIITVSYEGISITKDIYLIPPDSFIKLKNTIIETAESNIELDHNYNYNSLSDGELTNGIEITKDITIDGQSHTIDAKGLRNIFYFNDDTYTKTLILKNIIFANATTATDGASVYFKGKHIEIINCTFINDTASQNGGAVYIDEASANIVNSTFKENKALNSADAIYIAGTSAIDANITGCLFINNEGLDSVVELNLDSDAECNISNSIFEGNDAAYNVKAEGNVVADHNWWGNTNENYNVNIANVDGLTVNNWLFLNITNADTRKGIATVSLNNLFDEGAVRNYNQFAVIPISLNIGANGAVTRFDNVTLNETGQAKYQFAMSELNGELTASYLDIVTTKEIEYVIIDDGSFRALYDKIRFSNEDDVIELDKNYSFIEGVDTITGGITIGKKITILGNGFTIDGKSKAAIFWIQADNVVLKNITFANAVSDYGAAVYSSAESFTIDNCTFINNSVSVYGGAVCSYADLSMGTISNSIFINNTAASKGAAVYNYAWSYSATNTIEKCIFINNTASDSVVYYSGIGIVRNSIFLDNADVKLINSYYSSSVSLSNNWFGNTFDNYADKPNVYVSSFAWLYLNIKFYEDYALVSLNNLYSTSGSTSTATSYNLPNITLNINSTTLNLETDKITLDSKGQAVVPYTMIGETGALTVNYGGVSLTKDRLIGEFDELQNLIDSYGENSLIELNKNYTFIIGADELTSGILIDKNLTIDGKGFTINAKNMARIFDVKATNVTFKNINFINAKSDYGSAIRLEMTNTVPIDFKVINCTFENNTATSAAKYAAAAIMIYAKEGSYLIEDSLFEDNQASTSSVYGGAIHINAVNAEFNVNNCAFINNTANKAGAIGIDTSDVNTLINCSSFIANSGGSFGSAIYLNEVNGGSTAVNNSIFLSTVNGYYINNAAGEINADNNWWGHIAGETPNKYTNNLYLLTSGKPNNRVFINCTITSYNQIYTGENRTAKLYFQLYNPDTGEVTSFDANRLPKVNITLSSEFGYFNKNKVYVDEEFIFNATQAGYATINADCGGINYPIDFAVKGKSEITLLNDTIILYYGDQPYLSNFATLNHEGKLTFESLNPDGVAITTGNKPRFEQKWADGEAIIAVSYEGSTYYDAAETKYFTAKLVQIPLIINVTNLNGNTLNLNVGDGINLTVELVVDLQNQTYHTGYTTPSYANFDIKYPNNFNQYDYRQIIDMNVIRGNANKCNVTGKAMTGGSINLTLYYKNNAFSFENVTILITVNRIPTEIDIVNDEPISLKVDDESAINANFYINGTLNTTTALNYESGDENIVEVISADGDIKAISEGTVLITVSFAGNSTHGNSTKTITVLITKYATEVTLNSNNVTPKYGDAIIITPTVKVGDSIINEGNVSYYIGDTLIASEIALGETFEWIVDRVAEFNITARYNGNGKYEESENNIAITSQKADNHIKINITNETYPNQVTINVTADIDDVYNVKVGDIIVPVRANTTVLHMFAASESYAATIDDWIHQNYTAVVTGCEFKVSKGINNVVVSVDDAYLPGFVTIRVSADVDGTYVVVLNGTAESEVIVKVEGGEGTNTTTLVAGSYEANASFGDYENYTVSIANDTFDVIKSDNVVVIEVSSVTYPDVVTIRVTATIGDTYNVKVGDVVIPVVANGDGVTYKFGACDDYVATVDGWTHDNYTAVVTDAEFSVSKGINNVVVTVDDSYLPGFVTIKVSADVDGTYVVVLNDTAESEVIVKVEGGEGTNTTTLVAGKYSANTSFADYENYTVSIANDTFDVIKSDNVVVIEVSSVTYPDEVIIRVTATIGDTYNVKVGDVVIPVVANGDGVTYKFGACDDYVATVDGWTHDNYTAVVTDAEFSVSKGVNNVVVTVDDSYLPGFVTIRVSADVDGTYVVVLNDTAESEVIVKVEGGEGTNTTTLVAGKYSANTSFADYENYTVSITNDTFEVKKSNIDLEIIINEIVHGTNVTGTIKTNLSGTYTVKIADSVEFDVLADVGTTLFTRYVLLEVAEGYQAEVSIAEQADYNKATSYDTFDVVQTSTDFNVTSSKETYIYNEEIKVMIELPDDAQGNITFYFSNGTYIGEISDVTQTTEFTLGILDVDSYSIQALYGGDNNYKSRTKTINFNVIKADNNIEVNVISGNYPDNITVVVNASVAGIYQIDINGTVYEIEANSTGMSYLLNSGNYYANITYSHKNYNGITKNTTFTVNKGTNNVVVDISSVTYPYNVTVKLMADVEGTYQVDINGTIYDIVANDLPKSINLAAGTYYANVTGELDSNYVHIIKNTEFTVSKALNIVFVEVNDMTLPGDVFVKVIANVPGVYTVTIANETLDVEVGIDGEGNNTINLPAGKAYFATTTFENENYTSRIFGSTFDVNKAINNVVVEVSGVVYPDGVVLRVIADVDGVYDVDVNGTVYSVVANGTSDPIHLAAGTYFANVTGYVSDIYEAVISNADFIVDKKVNNIKVDVDDVVLPGNVVVNVTADVDGVYVVDINGTLVNVDVVAGKGSNTTILSAGKGYLATTSFINENYTAIIIDSTFDVNKGINNVVVEVSGVVYPDGVVLRVIADVDGVYDVGVNGTVYSVVANGTSDLIYLAAGDYIAGIVSYESDVYDAVITNATFTVSKKANNVKVTVGDVVLPGSVVVNVTADVDGVYVVDINGTLVNVDVVAGRGSNVTSLPAGISYNATTSFADSQNYTISIENAVFNVVKGINNVVVEVSGVVYPDGVVIRVIADVDGVYDVDVNGTVYSVVANDTSDPIHLAAGTYFANVTGYESDIYEAVISNADFIVDKKVNNIKVDVDDVVLPGNVVVNVTADVDGVYVVDINGTLVNVDVVAGRGSNVTSLPAGISYNATTNFADSQNYTIKIENAIFDVNKSNEIEINISVEDNAMIITSPNANGNVSVEVNGTVYSATLVNGFASIPIDLYPGEYYSNVTYVDESHDVFIKDAVISIPKVNIPIESNLNITIPRNTTSPDFIISLSDDATGNITVIIDDQEYSASLVNGSATINVPELDVGDYNATVIYSGDDKYNSTSANITFNVPKAAISQNSTSIIVEYPSGAEYPKLIVELPDDATGNISIIVGGEEIIVANLVNGSTIIPLDNLSPGSYIAEIKYGGNRKYEPISREILIISENKKIETEIEVNETFTFVAVDTDVNEPCEMFYITLKDIDGNILINKTLNIVLNGVTYSYVTNESGMVSVKVNLSVADVYSYAIAFQGDKVYNVAPLSSTILDITKKPTSISAKSLKIEAKEAIKPISVTLKTVKNQKDGKVYLAKGKLVTFTFKGKTYSSRTNSNGVAKFNIKLTNSGLHTAIFKFAGDGTYKACRKSVTVNIYKKRTVITASAKKFKSQAKIKSYSAILKAVNKKTGVDVRIKTGKIVKLIIKGQTYTAKTDPNGIAKFNVDVSKIGSYTAKLVFAGDTTYKLSTKLVKITIY